MISAARVRALIGKGWVHETKGGYIEVEAIEIYQLPGSPEPSRPVNFLSSALLEKNGPPCSET